MQLKQVQRIEALVDAVLAHHPWPRPPVRVERLAKGLGIRLVRLPLQDDGDALSGYYARRGRDQVIAVNDSHPPVRQRFTIAHELAHAVLHPGDELHIDQTFRLRDRHAGAGVDPDEIAANAFAARLLMPEEDLRRAIGEEGVDIGDDTELRDLARRFAVSQQALAYRLADLGWLEVDGKAAF